MKLYYAFRQGESYSESALLGAVARAGDLLEHRKEPRDLFRRNPNAVVLDTQAQRPLRHAPSELYQAPSIRYI